YLTPVSQSDADFAFSGESEDYPEDWIDLGPPVRLKPTYRKYAPTLMSVRADGMIGPGAREFWFIPGKFRFCLRCKDQPAPQARELTKLAGLSGEGRSSATTLL